MVVCALGAAAMSFYFFLQRPDLFNRLTQTFEEDPLTRYEPLIFYCVRFTMGLLMGVLINFQYAWTLVLCLQLAHVLYIIVKRPYVDKKVLIASVFNEAAAILFIVMTPNAQSGPADSEVWIVAAVTLLNCLLITYILCSKVYDIFSTTLTKTALIHSDSSISMIKSSNRDV
jgi:hypothetical protein